MISLQRREISLKYVRSGLFSSCPNGPAVIYNSVSICNIFPKRSPAEVFVNCGFECPCIEWNEDYAREYYWTAMNPFFGGGY